MTRLGAVHLADGRPTHQILAIEERFDAVTIAVAPQRVRSGTLAACVALLTFAAALWTLLVVCALGMANLSLTYRLLIVGLLAVPPLAVAALIFLQLRKAMNWRTITVGDGLVSLAGGPITPQRKTLQLSDDDGMRVAYRERNAATWWPTRNEKREPVREYCIYVSGKRGKNDWDVELVPPFTLSLHEANKLASLLQKFAYAPTEESLIGSRI